MAYDPNAKLRASDSAVANIVEDCRKRAISIRSQLASDRFAVQKYHVPREHRPWRGAAFRKYTKAQLAERRQILSDRAAAYDLIADRLVEDLEEGR